MRSFLLMISLLGAMPVAYAQDHIVRHHRHAVAQPAAEDYSARYPAAERPASDFGNYSAGNVARSLGF